MDRRGLWKGRGVVVGAISPAPPPWEEHGCRRRFQHHGQLLGSGLLHPPGRPPPETHAAGEGFSSLCFNSEESSPPLRRRGAMKTRGHKPELPSMSVSPG